MTERYTVVDVRNAFDTFVELAGQLGFDTRFWSLEEGNSAYHRQYRHVRSGAYTGDPFTTEFRPELGSNAREAWRTLSARIDTLRALRELRGETEVTAGQELEQPAPTNRRRPRLP